MNGPGSSSGSRRASTTGGSASMASKLSASMSLSPTPANSPLCRAWSQGTSPLPGSCASSTRAVSSSLTGVSAARGPDWTAFVTSATRSEKRKSRSAGVEPGSAASSKVMRASASRPSRTSAENSSSVAPMVAGDAPAAESDSRTSATSRLTSRRPRCSVARRCDRFALSRRSYRDMMLPPFGWNVRVCRAGPLRGRHGPLCVAKKTGFRQGAHRAFPGGPP